MSDKISLGYHFERGYPCFLVQHEALASRLTLRCFPTSLELALMCARCHSSVSQSAGSPVPNFRAGGIIRTCDDLCPAFELAQANTRLYWFDPGISCHIDGVAGVVEDLIGMSEPNVLAQSIKHARIMGVLNRLVWGNAETYGERSFSYGERFRPNQGTATLDACKAEALSAW